MSGTAGDGGGHAVQAKPAAPVTHNKQVGSATQECPLKAQKVCDVGSLTLETEIEGENKRTLKLTAKEVLRHKPLPASITNRTTRDLMGKYDIVIDVIAGYPTREEERKIMDRMTQIEPVKADALITPAEIENARGVISQIYVDDKVKDYIVDVVFATREPAKHGLKDLAPLVEWGASPRASIALNLAARAHAFLRHRGYVTPEDVKAIGPDVLRHRLVLTYEADAEEITAEQIVRRVFEVVEVP